MKRAWVSVVFFLWVSSLWAQGVPSTVWDVHLRGIGGTIGVVFPEDARANAIYGGHLDLGTIASLLRLLPSVEYWNSPVDDPTLRNQGVERLKDLVINGDVRVELPVGLLFHPYVGGGLSVHFIRSEGQRIPPALKTRINDTSFGFNAMAGLVFTLIPHLDVFGEVRGNLVEDANQLRVQAGATLIF